MQPSLLTPPAEKRDPLRETPEEYQARLARHTASRGVKAPVRPGQHGKPQWELDQEWYHKKKGGFQSKWQRPGFCKVKCYMCGTMYWEDHANCPECLTENELERGALREGYQSSYSYDFDRPLSYREEHRAVEDTLADTLGYQPKTAIGKSMGFRTEWSEYEKTGQWRGYDYYARPQLDYRYVEQMANAFAAKYNVEVNVGTDWAIDVKKKEMTYNPLTLLDGTKAHLIATLLHEIGHLRHSTHRDDLKGKWVKNSEPVVSNNAYEIVNTFEDFRIDKLMAQSYEGAEDVFKANAPIVEKVALQYEQRSKQLKKFIVNRVKAQMAKVLNELEEAKGEKTTEEERVKALQGKFGSNYKTLEDFKKMVEDLEEAIDKRETFFDYCAAILVEGYGVKAKAVPPGIEAMVKKTIKAVSICERAKTTQVVVDTLDKIVFPVIKDLLNDASPDGGSMQKALGKFVGDKEAQSIMDMARQGGMLDTAGISSEVTSTWYNPKTGRIEQTTGQKVRSSGHSTSEIPPAFASGDYSTLANSVRTAIEELVRRLTFLRRKEQSLQYENKQRSGVLDIARLFKIATGNFRVFKRKMETQDTLKSFSFSIMLDVSGSMTGYPQLNSTRGLVLLSEVFHRMEVPFEVMMFDNGVSVVKDFQDAYEGEVKVKVGRMVKAGGGGTNLYKALDKTLIEKQPERNRYVIILSDGGVGSHGDYYSKFEEWKRRGIKTIGVGISCGDEIVRLCLGRGISLTDATKLPEAFASILKDLLLKKK